MSDENDKKKLPDHTLENGEPPEVSKDEPPEVYAVTDLRALVKPELDEELGSSSGGVASFGTEVVCTCVPVETCVCNTVSYNQGGNPCACTGTCVGGLYWHPY